MNQNRNSPPVPSGWDYHSYNPRQEYGSGLNLLLPTDLRYQLQLEEKAALERDKQLSDADYHLAVRKADDVRAARKADRKVDAPKPKPEPSAPVLEPVAPPGSLNVFKVADVHQRLAKLELRTSDRDYRDTERKLLTELVERGPTRAISGPPPDCRQLADLRIQQPHFAQVVDLIVSQLNLAHLTGEPLRIPPILLNGEPGVGKTYFCHRLAEAVGTVVRRQSYDSDATAACLLGSDRKWANTAPGLVFDLLAMGKVANPIILLDEIDKARDCNGQSALTPLHSLLEPETASAVRDISVDLELNASLVIWVATANQPRLLAPSLRSRFREFDIQRPPADQALKMAPALIQATLQRLKLDRFWPPSRALVLAVAHLTPREITQAIEHAAGTACAEGRSALLPSDVPVDFRDAGEGEAGDGGDPSLLH